ncbi:MAG TPA: FAD binding domain-containing protein, partial [Casimicrobiaceae bacterium]|nr:FAD binding domain-containing protein [Casimicrobiaceae bacterium]
MAIEEYRAPASLADALTCLRGGDYTVLAGGTDLMPQVHAGRVKFGRGLLNITRIDTLHAIERLGSTIRIGALVT